MCLLWIERDGERPEGRRERSEGELVRAKIDGASEHDRHPAALAEILDKAGVATVVHAFTDGRDTPPRSAGEDIARLDAALPRSVPIATVCGRYYAMDRDKRWERVTKAYQAIAEAEGPRFADARAAVADA